MMTMRILVAGLGSPHGDDQIGWRVSDDLRSRFGADSQYTVRTARVPLDLLDWLFEFDVVHLIDACLPEPDGEAWYQLFWREGGLAADNGLQVAADGWRSSHSWDVVSVLQLAAQLGRIPPLVCVWAICIRQTERGEEVSDHIQAVGRIVADRIESELAKITARTS